MSLHKACPEITYCACGVVFYIGMAVLYHYGAILVIKVGDGKRIAWQVVKETLFRLQVVVHVLMEIHVVTGKVRENSTCELQTTHTLLCKSM